MAVMTPTEANAFIANRLGVTSVPTYRPPTPVTPPPGTAIISRPIATVPITTVTRPIAPVTMPTTALPQPAFPQPFAPSPAPAAPPISPVSSQPVQTSITQPTVTPDHILANPGAYQEPQPYQTGVLLYPPQPSAPVMQPTSNGTTFGLDQNTWLVILVIAAVLLFMFSGKSVE